MLWQGKNCGITDSFYVYRTKVIRKFISNEKWIQVGMYYVLFIENNIIKLMFRLLAFVFMQTH